LNAILLMINLIFYSTETVDKIILQQKFFQ